MFRAFAAAFIVTVVLGACATNNLGDASRKLNVGMTEKEVTTLIGSEPKSVSMTTCGTKTGKPWQCKVYEYRNSWKGMLVIHFSQVMYEPWRVNDWTYF